MMVDTPPSSVPTVLCAAEAATDCTGLGSSTRHESFKQEGVCSRAKCAPHPTKFHGERCFTHRPVAWTARGMRDKLYCLIWSSHLGALYIN